MTDATTPADEQAAKPDSVPSGGGYSAVITRDGRVVWSCSHVHFTDHSARACAARELARQSP